MRRLVTGVVGLALLLTACTDDGTTPPPAAARAGRVTAPDPVLLPRPMPKRAVVTEVREITDEAQPLQTLYLPSGSTPEHGPALAVGHFGQDAGSLLCGDGRTLPDPGDAFTGLTRITRADDLIAVEGEVSTDEPGYVIGRGLSRAQVLRAARGITGAAGPRSGVATEALPRGFVRRATAPVIPLSTLMPGRLIGVRLSGTLTAQIMESELDPQARVLWDFWRATVARQRCPYGVPTMVARGAAVATVRATGPRFQERTARSLAPGTDAALARARRQATHPMAETVAADCGKKEIVLSGMQDRFTWVVAFDLTPTPLVCTVIDEAGHSSVGSVSGTFYAAASPPGSIELVDRGTMNASGIIAGRVGTDVGSVTVTPDGRPVQPAQMINVAADPDHRYWVLFSPSDPPFGRIVATAFGADGHLVATLASPP